ncbi:unnamed protein product [Phyllotreta striolata]|uniref:Right handed beta helix domain-containing protein n=1 Tax=Phyllotreta striolata TaxID=444603 RepID=A0A9N9TNW8_PHYSR|nr:unnamed protein product [Phyllotreta striolata]
MSLIDIIVFSLVLAAFSRKIANATQNRINFSKCDVGGFTCSTNILNNTTTLLLSFSCPAKDVTIYVNQFKSPYNMESLEIEDCENVTVSLKSADRRYYFEKLTVKNVGVLTVLAHRLWQTNAPKLVRMENVGYIRTIPSFAFGQSATDDGTATGTTAAAIAGSTSGLRRVFLRNVTVDTVESNAFRLHDACANFTVQNSRINRIQTSGIDVVLDKGGEFLVENTRIDVFEHLALRITGANAEFRNNKLGEMWSSAVNGTIENFKFSHNAVATLEAGAVAILCTRARLSHNRFEYVRSGGFGKISPGLLVESNRNFGQLRFVYEFRGNAIAAMDAGGLNPDFEAYGNVATDVLVKKNALLCSCFNIGWMFAETGHGFDSQRLRPFYDLLTDAGNENVCLSACNFPLSKAAEIFKAGNCPASDAPDAICSKTTNPIPIATTPKTIYMSNFSHKTRKNAAIERHPPTSIPLLLPFIISLTAYYNVHRV